MLALVWLVSVVLEPYLIALVVPHSAVGEARRSASGWANSNVWLFAQLASLLAILAAGFVSKILSPPGSWLAPGLLLLVCALYIFFAQFPATREYWRIGLWSLGTLAAMVFGAWLGRQRAA